MGTLSKTELLQCSNGNPEIQEEALSPFLHILNIKLMAAPMASQFTKTK
jgi:hypothetical protein